MADDGTSLWDLTLGYVNDGMEGMFYPELATLNGIYSAWTGGRSPLQKQQSDDELRAAIKQAGGSDEDAANAVSEMESFSNRFWPERTPIGTLWDDLKGDPLGLKRAPDGGGDQSPDWTFAIVIIVAIILFILIAKVALKHI